MIRVFFFLFTFVASAAQAQSPEELSGVGRLDLGARGFCTATLVEEGLVLTAAHCLFDKETGVRIEADTLMFHAGLTEGQPRASRAIATIVIHPKYSSALKGDLENMQHDLAMLRLVEDIPSEVIRPVAVSKPELGRPVSVVSYARARAESASVQGNCWLAARPEGIFVTDCLSDFGTSGAPVFQRQGGAWHVVSVISAMARADGAPVSLVVAPRRSIDRLKAEARPGAPSGRS